MGQLTRASIAVLLVVWLAGCAGTMSALQFSYTPTGTETEPVSP